MQSYNLGIRCKSLSALSLPLPQSRLPRETHPSNWIKDLHHACVRLCRDPVLSGCYSNVNALGWIFHMTQLNDLWLCLFAAWGEQQQHGGLSRVHFAGYNAGRRPNFLFKGLGRRCTRNSLCFSVLPGNSSATITHPWSTAPCSYCGNYTL